MEFRYYLYRHIRIDSGLPFYIGIGTKPKKFNTYTEEYRRAYKQCDRKKFWKNVVSKAGFKVEIMIESNDYESIKESEKSFIQLYGRKDINQGELVNHTDGGEGAHGRVWKPSIEHISKVIEANKKRKLSPSHLLKLNDGRRNTPTTEESRLKYSMASIGRVASEESRLKNSLAKQRGKHPKSRKMVNISTNQIFECGKDAAEYAGIEYTNMIRKLRRDGIYKNIKYYDNEQ